MSRGEGGKRFGAFRMVLAGATLFMVVLSWPLWTGNTPFPRVPLVAGWPEPGGWLTWGLAAILAGALALVVIGRGGRWDWLTSLIALSWLLLGDQGRLQPWALQYGVIGLAVLFAGPKQGLTLARWYTIVLYAASALSKLDAAFVDEVGETFLATLGRLVGLDPTGWSRGVRTLAILAMPTGELAVAVALAIPALRPWGLAGSAVQHLATIAVLSPWGLDHSAIVLVWNGAFLVENCILFAGTRAESPGHPAAGRVAAAVVIALVAAERWGWVDSWPAHALYASHAERAALLWPEAAAADLPLSARRWLGPADEDGYARLDLTGWSRAERGVPAYPQNRYACGVAEALVARDAARPRPPGRLILWDRAGVDRRPPRRQVECVGLPAIRTRLARFWINARPAP